jgi:hypothetical protein
MKNIEGLVVSAKLFCVFAGTSLLTLQTGLGSLAQSDKPATNIQWAMVVGGSLGTGLTAAGAFLSNAFGNYMNNVNINGNPITSQTGSINPLLTEVKKDATVKPVL